MTNEAEAATNPETASVGQYECLICHPSVTVNIFSSFLIFIDHLIEHLCRGKHPKLAKPFLVDGSLWYRDPDDPSRMSPPLPPYEPNSRAWQVLTDPQRILPQARFFLPNVAHWLEPALGSLAELNAIEKSSLLAADRLVELVRGMSQLYQEQRDYLCQYEQRLRETGMDPKWPGRPGRQAWFVSRSMAGARWGLTPSTSRDYVRQEKQKLRRPVFRDLGFRETPWWEPR